RAALPPARIIVIFCDLVEAELLVVVGTDPLGCVDRAFLQRGIDVTARDLLRNEAELAESLTRPTADAHLQALEVLDRVDLLAEPSTHLAAGVAHQEAFRIELGAEVVDQLLAVTFVEPGVLLARIESERHGAEQSPGRILADIIILRAVTEFDGAVLH